MRVVDVRGVVAAALLLSCAGCSGGSYAVRPRTEVEIKDPSLVSVEADTPTGRQTLLPPGRDVVDVPVPRTEPPMSRDVRVDASVGRTSNGGIVVRCAGCNTTPYRRVLDSPTIVFDGAVHAKDVLTIGATDLRMPVKYHWGVFHEWTGPHGSHHVDEVQGGDAFRVDLVTPLSNVVRIRERTDDERDAAASTFEVGVAFLVAGAATAALGVYSATKLFSTDSGNKALPAVGFAAGVGLAPLLLLFGGAATVVGLDKKNAPVWDRAVYP